MCVCVLFSAILGWLTPNLPVNMEPVQNLEHFNSFQNVLLSRSSMQWSVSKRSDDTSKVLSDRFHLGLLANLIEVHLKTTSSSLTSMTHNASQHVGLT